MVRPSWRAFLQTASGEAPVPPGMDPGGSWPAVPLARLPALANVTDAEATAAVSRVAPPPLHVLTASGVSSSAVDSGVKGMREKQVLRTHRQVGPMCNKKKIRGMQFWGI